MASGPITSWQIDGETVSDFIFGKSWLTWKDPGKYWERLKAGEEDDRGWDGRMASPTDMSWINSWSQWWTGRPGMLRFMGLQRVRHDWATQLNWAWPHPSEQDPVSPSVSLPHQEAFIRLLFFSIRGQTDWKASSQKTNQSFIWTTALSNSMKLWAIPCRATQDRWAMVESSDKMWSTGEGSGKPL